MSVQTLRAPVLIQEENFDPAVSVFAPKSEFQNISHIAMAAGAISVSISMDSIGGDGNPLKEVFCLFQEDTDFDRFYRRLSKARYTVIIPA